MYYAAKTHNFDNTIKIGTKTVATTDLLTAYAATAGATFTGVITFPTSMSLGTTAKGTRINLWPGSTTTDWYGLGMAASKLIYSIYTCGI